MRERKRNTFNKELRHMLYGFGDVPNPRMDTVETLGDYIVEYISLILNRTLDYSRIKGKTKTEDLLFALRKDRKKYTRAKDLLILSEEVRKARKLMDFEAFEKDDA